MQKPLILNRKGKSVFAASSVLHTRFVLVLLRDVSAGMSLFQ